MKKYKKMPKDISHEHEEGEETFEEEYVEDMSNVGIEFDDEVYHWILNNPIVIDDFYHS